MIPAAAALIALTVAAAAPVQTDSLFSVAWKQALVEPYLLEYKPFEPAGPAVDPLTGMVVVATRDGYIQAFDKAGKELWHHPGKGPYLAPPGVGDGVVVVAGLDGKVHALDAARGTERWDYSYREEFGSQPVIAGDLVYLATLEGTILALDARTGAWRWHFRREPTGKFIILGVGRPTIVDGLLYRGFADGSVVALDALTGAVKWDRKVGRGTYPDICATVFVAKDRVFVVGYGGQVAALERANGNTVWESKATEPYKAVLDGDVLVTVTTKDVVGFDTRTGRQLWSTPHEGAPISEPTFVKNLILVPNGAGLLLLDRRSGRKVRFFTRGSGATATPAVSGNRVYFLSNTAELLAVDLQ